MTSASPGDGYSSEPQGTGTPSASLISMLPPTEKTITKIPSILPPERVFPIQIGSELFKLSGASLSSDAPSYFSQYFLCQIKQAGESGERDVFAIRTLYIDRDPETFRDIALHLQGYHVAPRDGKHFVRLFADAQFYSLPKLISQLYDESIFISIGHREFQIPRDLLTDPRNSPNYFSLGFAFFFARPDNLFPGLDREGLLRPPSILPPSVPNRNADTFAELLRLLRGYPINIRDETHRQELLRDARYFHFKGLEQQLLPHSIQYNSLRGHAEITIRLENVQKSGISVLDQRASPLPPSHNPDVPFSSSSSSSYSYSSSPFSARINYARPYIDDLPANLILQIGNESSIIHFRHDAPRVEFLRDTKTRVAKLLEVIATKLNLPPTTRPLGLLMASGGALSQPATPGNTPLSEDLIRAFIGPDADITLDGKDHHISDSPAKSQTGLDDGLGSNANPRKRNRSHGSHHDSPWTVLTAQWRLHIQATNSGKSAVECVFVAVKIDAVSSERARNKARRFLA